MHRSALEGDAVPVVFVWNRTILCADADVARPRPPVGAAALLGNPAVRRRGTAIGHAAGADSVAE